MIPAAIWLVITNTAGLAVMTSLLFLAADRGDGLLMTAIAFTYLSTLSTFSSLDRSQAESSGRAIAHFARILRLLNDPEPQPYEDLNKEMTLYLHRSALLFRLNTFFRGVGYCVTLLFLAVSLF